MPELGEEQVQVVWALDDMHRSLVQVDGTLQVLQVDVQVQADVAQVLELVGVEQVVGKGQVEDEGLVEDEEQVLGPVLDGDASLVVASLVSELQNRQRA